MNKITSVQDGLNMLLSALYANLLETKTTDKIVSEVRGKEVFNEFNITVIKIIKNVLNIIKSFKEKFKEPLNPLLLRLYADNYLWLKNLTLELHRLMAPIDPSKKELAAAFANSFNDAPKSLLDIIPAEMKRLIGDLLEYPEYIKCPNCETLGNEVYLNTDKKKIYHLS